MLKWIAPPRPRAPILAMSLPALTHSAHRPRTAQQHMKVGGRGCEGPKGSVPGDLYVAFRVARDAVFERDNGTLTSPPRARPRLQWLCLGRG